MCDHSSGVIAGWMLDEDDEQEQQHDDDGDWGIMRLVSTMSMCQCQLES